MMQRRIGYILIVIVSLGLSVGAQNCLHYGSLVSLTGDVKSREFAALANEKGNEVVRILTLDRAICITGRDQTGFDFPERRVIMLQLSQVPDEWKFFRGRLVVTGSLFRRFSPHQRTKVLIKVVHIAKIAPGAKFRGTYPDSWFAPINDPNKPDWEILPQEAKPGEVILSKRNELGILSNFAATPFELYGKRYASVEGFWQMMLYPPLGPDEHGQFDPRAKSSSVQWKYTREQVAQMTGFEAKAAGTLAENNLSKINIDWVTFDGKRFPYRSATPGEHYRLIVAAMRAKLEQNPEVKRILLATGDLILKPDHHGENNAPPEWDYCAIWMQLRSELQSAMQKPGPQ